METRRSRAAVFASLLIGSLLAACSAEPEPELEFVGQSDVPICRGCNVVLLVVDTLRSDHLGVYGYERATSPIIDALSSGALVFTSAIAQSSWTRPSTASILTGLHPRNHGAITRSDRLAREVPLISEILQRAGYFTAAVVANPNVLRSAGFGQGYDRFTPIPGRRMRKPTNVATNADAVNRGVFEALDAARGRERNLFYVHYMDPHAPYAAPERLFSRGDAMRFGYDQLEKIPKMSGSARSRARRQMINAYDDEIRYVDKRIGALFLELAKREMLARSIVVLVSDHGEEFLEHGDVAHGRTLHREVLRVPLIIRVPGATGRRIDALANQIDIVPTLLAILGIDAPTSLDGRNLLDPASEGEISFTDLHLDRWRAQAAITRTAKLIREREPGGSEYSLRHFDLESDPLEQHPLIEPATQDLGAALTEFLAAPRAEIGSTEPVVHNPEELEQLEALGYIE